MRLLARVAAVFGIVACACLALAGAGSAESGAGAAAAGPSETVSIVEFRFTPGRIVVPEGTRVTFQNTSSYTHTASHPGVFDTGHIPPGQSATVRFKQPGTYSYHCHLHPFMTGKIVVK